MGPDTGRRVLAVAVGTALAAVVAVTQVGAAPQAADAASSTAVVQGKVTRIAHGATTTAAKIQVQLVNAAGKVVRHRKTGSSGVYQFFGVVDGTYTLSFDDGRPIYNTSRATTVSKTLRISRGSVYTRNVTLRTGGSITGIVAAGPKRAGGVRILAIDKKGDQVLTKANDKGQFAIGGLATTGYTLFFYDRKKQWGGPDSYAEVAKPGQKVWLGTVHLSQRTGSLYLTVLANGTRVKKVVTATVVNKATGQFWIVNVKKGRANIAGLTPGRYTVTTTGVNSYLGKSVKTGRIKSRNSILKTINLTKHGGQVDGTVKDAATGMGVPGVAVTEYNADGSIIAATKTNSGGYFKIGGAYPKAKVSVVIQKTTVGTTTYPRREYKVTLRDGRLENLHDILLSGVAG